MLLKSVLSYLPKSPCHPSVSAFPKVQTALKASRELGEGDGEVHFYCIPVRNPALGQLLKKPNS